MYNIIVLKSARQSEYMQLTTLVLCYILCMYIHVAT